MTLASDAHVAPGDILVGKYRVERVLGRGSMGVVVAATHLTLGQVVALKFMISGRVASPQLHERFLREARAAAGLKSHHVAKVLDAGALENGAPYIVMEFLEGQDLAARLARRGPCQFEETVEYVLQACEGIAEAHADGIVHRDLKPANLFLTRDASGAPCLKVLDFGISKLSGSELAITQATQLLGSPLYMSPEQLRSANAVDRRSDIWALGVILYELVAGQTPFHADTVEELGARVLFGDPTPLARLRPDAPAGFEAVILRCLQKEREKRFDDIAGLAFALAPYAPARAAGYPERVARVLGIGRGLSYPTIVPDSPHVAESTPTRPSSPPTVPMVLGHAASFTPAPTGYTTPPPQHASYGSSASASYANRPSYPHPTPMTRENEASLRPLSAERAPTPIPPPPTAKRRAAIVAAITASLLLAAAIVTTLVLLLRPTPTRTTAAGQPTIAISSSSVTPPTVIKPEESASPRATATPTASASATPKAPPRKSP